MLHRKLSPSSTSTSRRVNRRLKLSINSFGWLLKIAAIFMGVLVIIFLLSKAFTVRKVSCRLNEKLCPIQVNDALDHFVGKNFFSVKKSELKWSIDQTYPANKFDFRFSYPNTLAITISVTETSYPISSFQVQSLPSLTLDLYGNSTASASWHRPVPEIKRFLTDYTGMSQKLWQDGQLTSQASGSASIDLIYTHLPSASELSRIFKFVSLAEKYLNAPQIYILQDRIFLSASDIPDIIIYTDADIKNVEISLQSLDYLATIKKDARVINLSFDHPIIK